MKSKPFYIPARKEGSELRSPDGKALKEAEKRAAKMRRQVDNVVLDKKLKDAIKEVWE